MDIKSIQWYPGHMTKALRQMQEDLKLIDLVIELLDARVPLASQNPDIDRLSNGKARLLLLNKADLADKRVTDDWKAYFKGEGKKAIALDSRNRGALSLIRPAVDSVMEKKRERDRRRGIKNRPVRALVAGIPNIGKSTLINSIAGRKSAKTGNKPGVTKGKQWIRLSGTLDLLDTPGILWPKFEDERAGFLLAATNAIKDEVLPTEELARALFEEIRAGYPGQIFEKYGLEETLSNAEILSELAKQKSLLRAGGKADEERAARLLLDDFRNGRIGKISLERPQR